ncbi:MAG: hypothetical protein KF778_02655 [Rhodocyclaceae bacterium]|nr:hypothetical protein [Rhodocyclaceae bacterium]
MTARALGPEGRGTYFYWVTLAGMAIQFGNLGLHSSNAYQLARGQANFATLASNSLWLSLCGGAVLAPIVAVMAMQAGFVGSSDWIPMVMTLLLVPPGLYFMLGTNLLIAEERINEYNLFSFANQYVALTLILCAAWYRPSVEIMLAAAATGAIVVCVPLYRRLTLLGGAGRRSIAVIRAGIGYGLRAYCAGVLSFLVMRINAVLLKDQVAAAEMGEWSIAVQLLDVVNLVPATIALVLLPRMLRERAPYRLMRTQLGATAMVLIPLCLLAAAIGREFLALVYGARFAGAYPIFLYGLPGAVALGLIGICSQYLAAAGIPLALLAVWLAGLVLQCVLSLALIPLNGAVGATAALSMTYVVMFGLIVRLCGRVERSNRENAHAY